MVGSSCRQELKSADDLERDELGARGEGGVERRERRGHHDEEHEDLDNASATLPWPQAELFRYSSDTISLLQFHYCSVCWKRPRR